MSLSCMILSFIRSRRRRSMALCETFRALSRWSAEELAEVSDSRQCELVPEDCLGKIRSYSPVMADLDGVFPDMYGGGSGLDVFVVLVGEGVDALYCGDT